MHRAATPPVRDVYPDTVTVLGSKIPTEEIREEWEKTSGSMAITFLPQKPCRCLSISVQQQHHRALHGRTGGSPTQGGSQHKGVPSHPRWDQLSAQISQHYHLRHWCIYSSLGKQSHLMPFLQHIPRQMTTLQ